MPSWPSGRKKGPRELARIGPGTVTLPAAVPLLDLWPPFPPARILFEDDDLVVVDKPASVATHAPDATQPLLDDLVSRLKRALGERDGRDPAEVYLGIHQRLDADTSGVLLFTKRKSANPAVAAEFEGRRVKKAYLAGVVGWPAARREGVMRHQLVPAGPGRYRVATDRRGASVAREAVTHYRMERRIGERALLSLRPETGRTHQLRVQIGAMGASIAGDRLYGGAPAPRLMLHAVELAIRHPTSGRVKTVRAEAPPSFDVWLSGLREDPLRDGRVVEARLRDAAERRWGLGRAPEPSAFRLANEAGDGLAGVAVDVYGSHLLVHLYSPEGQACRERILDAAASLAPSSVYLKTHPKQANTLVDTHVESLAPSHALRGVDAPDPLVIRESGLSYRVRLGDGLKTGIFLDQRENRRIVRGLSPEKRVLNLFAYTCAFTVAAAAGGAANTVSVDVSPGTLVWGRENLEQNGLWEGRHELVHADVFVWLKEAKRRAARFDLVILDPPSYATTHKSRFSAESDYHTLAAEALALVAPGGRLLACTNHRGITRAKFRRALHQAGREADRELVQVKDLPDPEDFPPPYGAEPHLKSVLVTTA